MIISTEAVDGFDLSLNIGGSNHDNHNPNPTSYMPVDQTFHTPSFGDEEFDIPPLNLPSTEVSHNGDVFGSQGYDKKLMFQPLSHPQPQGQGLGMDHPGVITSSSATRSPSVGIMDNGQSQYPVVQEMYLPHMGGGDGSRGVMQVHNMHVPIQSYNSHHGYGNPQLHQSQLQSMPPPQLPPSGQHQYQQTISGHMRTLNQSQLSSQLGMHMSMTHPGAQAPGSVGGSPRSNQTSPGHETSEDSDDSNALAQLMVGVKRPSPEPVEPTTTHTPNNKSNKKPKVQKKKKRDPNEPQKPVSAYALFFRDTQAAIKGQNPSASFGEVSKIVASMWDGLDAEHKSMYKKKTEAAKKEYLKALAAYRASLVSKAANDQSDNLGGNSVTSTTMMSSTALSNSSSNQQSLSNLQKKSPLLTSLIEGSSVSVAMTQPQPPVLSSQVWTMAHPMNGTRGMHQQPMHLVQVSHGTPAMLHQQMGGPVQQMLPMGNRSAMSQMPPPSQPVSSAPSSYSQNVSTVLMPNNHGMTMSQNILHGQQQLQNNCTNPTVNNQDWEKEYCGNDYVVSNCRYIWFWHFKLFFYSNFGVDLQLMQKNCYIANILVQHEIVKN
ncbi:thymocyte selection-associated high mobility group box protein TOX-like isoform X2 [Limulus polyphemus]|uniref:Thymocyte selection-associated high mobility group box protein TOX-like isoform X2 n=1 Tax=Limulus polyphemus TaxID=6850 RepID=A0ABM1S1M2_LIMPO|nr:thymocyte selection-associated high mobility group box protein TOX-like isoform X2 [Limulus polyphemus]XP_022237536.1 thymocyte selection-associated high mobility group box protein TOX-like isoform X2 [Limulus polyphemus]